MSDAPTHIENEAINAIGKRWVDWMGQPPRPITNQWGAAAEAIGALKARPDLLVRLLIESGAVSEVVQGKELLDPEGEWDDCTWLAVNVSLDAESVR